MNHRFQRWQVAVGALGMLGVAAFVYRPWVALPFNVWDYYEFLPILRATPGAADQLAELVSYYSQQGRQNTLFYATFVVQWHLFGEDNLGWQGARFGTMAIVVGLSWVVLRRFGLTRFSAAAGSSLFLAGTAVSRAWVQLMAEPQALIALLLATLFALRFQETPHWKASAVGIAALVGFVALSKEVLVVLAGLVVLLALCWQADGTLRIDRRSPRNRLLGSLALAVVLMVGGLLLYVRQLPIATGYGMAYGQGALSLGRFGEILLAELLPLRSGAGAALGLLYPANLLFMVVVVLGWRERLFGSAASKRAWIELGLIAAIPIVGALVYLPWPKYDSFYALPFHFGAVLLFGSAVSNLEKRGKGQQVVVWIAAGLTVAYLALASRRAIAVSSAALRLNAALARNLPAFQSFDSVVIAGPRTGPEALPVSGEELRLYAIAMGYAEPEELPAVRDTDCEGGRRLLRDGMGRQVLASYSYGCGRFQNPSVRLTESYRYRDWLTLAPVHDSISADFLVPR